MTESIELAFVQKSETDNLKSVEPDYKYLANTWIGGSVAVVNKRQFEPNNVRIDEEGGIITCVINRRTYINVYTTSWSKIGKTERNSSSKILQHLSPKILMN